MFRIISTDASLDYPADVFFRIMNFSDRFRQFFKLFCSFQREMFINFLEFRKKYSIKTARWSLVLLMMQREAYLEISQATTMEFFVIIVNGQKLSTIFQKISILDIRLSSKYATAAGLSSYKDIFQSRLDSNPYYLSPVHLFAIFFRLLWGQTCSFEEPSTTLSLA